MVTPLILDLKSADSNVRSVACQKLKELGSEARAAVPALVAALDESREDTALVGAIADILGAIGPDARAAVPLLVPLVNQDGVYWGGIGNQHDAEMRLAIARAVLQIGAEPAQERLALRSLLRSARGLCFDYYPLSPWRWEKELMRPRAERVISGLSELLADSDPHVRSRAAETLAGYGTQARTVVPALVAALNDPAPGVRIQVALTLTAVEPARRSEAIAALLPLLSNPDTIASVRDTLEKVGEDPIPHLLALLRQSTGEAQTPYIEALVAIGEAGLAASRQELRGSSVTGRLGAARTLGLLASRAQAAFHDLVVALQDPDAGVRGEAAQALVEIDSLEASPALPHLTSRLESADATVRGTIVKLLGRMGPAAAPALPALVDRLTDPEVCLEAALALVAIDPRRAAPAVPVLVDALNRFDPEAPSDPGGLPGLLAALGRIGVSAAGAAPLIRKFLAHWNATVRLRAVSALMRVAPEAPESKADAVQTLLLMVADVDDVDGIYWEALATLGEVGPAAGEVVPQLEGMLFDEEKRGMAGLLCPGDPVAKLFSALVKIAPTRASRVLEDRRSEGVWNSLLVALGELGPAASPVVPVLQGLLSNTTPDRADNLKALLEGINRGLSYVHGKWVQPRTDQATGDPSDLG